MSWFADAPLDAQVYLDGLYYKVGRFGFVFVWTCGEWIRSTKRPSELAQGVEL